MAVSTSRIIRVLNLNRIIFPETFLTYIKFIILAWKCFVTANRAFHVYRTPPL